jgi:hypothetical protein
MKNQNPNEQIDMEEQVGIFAEAAGGGLMSLANGGMTEERKARFRKRLKNPALGVILGGKPVVTVDEEGKTTDAVVPSLLDVLKQVRKEEIKYGEAPKPKLKSNAPTVSVDEFKKFSEIEIPEGADDELTQEEFLEQVTTGATPSDSDSGFSWENLLSQYAEGFDAAAPYLASYAKQKGWDDSAEGLKGISDAALKKAQIDYYKGLGAKAKAYEAIERLKTNRALTKEAVATEIKTIELRLKDLQSKEEFMGLSETEQIERDGLTRALEEVRIRFGAFPGTTSKVSGRAKRESP